MTSEFVGIIWRLNGWGDVWRWNTVDSREYFDNRGKLVKSQEGLEARDHFDMTWFYNGDEEAVRAEKDKDGDGRPEIWYFYDKGKNRRVEEDGNGDGKPDVWEEYDGAEALVRRSKDLNLDGKEDVVETIEQISLSRKMAMASTGPMGDTDFTGSLLSGAFSQASEEPFQGGC